MYANSEAAHDVNWAAPAEHDLVAVKYGVIRVKVPIDVKHCPSEVYAAARSAAVIGRVEGLGKLDSSARCLEETSQYYPAISVEHSAGDHETSVRRWTHSRALCSNHNN